MGAKKVAVLGIKDKPVLEHYTDLCREFGFKVFVSRQLQNTQGIEKIGDLYIVEMHFGCKGKLKAKPGCILYDSVRDRVEAGEVGFSGISKSISVIHEAVEYGVPRQYLHLKPWNPRDFLQKWQ